MPVYSVSRTSQYTTVAALETTTNQDGFSWDANPLNAGPSAELEQQQTVLFAKYSEYVDDDDAIFYMH